MAAHSGSGADDMPVTVPRVPAREAAEEELSKPVYHQDDPNLLEQALDWLWERVGDLLEAAAGLAPGDRVGLAAIVLAVLLLLLALRLRLGAVRPGPMTAGGALLDGRPRSAAEHRAAAERYAAAGDWSEALRERMRAVVRSLEERDLLDPRPGRTADEAAAEAARALPGLAPDLRAAALAFDEVAYAGWPADRAAYDRLRDLDIAAEQTRPLPASARSGAAAADGGTT